MKTFGLREVKWVAQSDKTNGWMICNLNSGFQWWSSGLILLHHTASQIRMTKHPKQIEDFR